MPANSEVRDTTHPRTWVLLGRKAGDNAQLRALADALGWPWEARHISARAWELVPHLLLGPTLLGIDRSGSSTLAPPWPDLVLTAGRRNEPVARWIQRRAGGRTHLVHVGRPWAPPAVWDLVVTTPQYNLPPRHNIRHNTLPLCDLPEATLVPAGEALAPELADLPRPWIAVILGGDSGKFVFTPEKGRRLAALAERLAASSGGSVIATTSPRTPPRTAAAFARTLRAPHFLRPFGDGANPYPGFLDLADAFVVTGESMSMLAETGTRGRPLYLFDLGDVEPWWRQRHGWRYKPLSHRLAMRFGPERMKRDIGRMQDRLVEDGRARWLDDDSAAAPLPPPVPLRDNRSATELAASARAVRALFQSSEPAAR